MQNLRKLSISNLNFLMADPNVDLAIKKCAEKELERRCIAAGWSSSNLFECDFYKIRQRGFDIDKYLIGPNPNMQLLMELYFAYIYGDSDNMLLFSEKHFYNNIGFFTSFFSKIRTEEIKNLDERMKTSNNENLQFVKDLILQTIMYDKALKKELNAKDLLKNNEIFRTLCEERIKIGMNFDEKFLKFIGYNENSVFSTASDLIAILHDSDLLKEQKRLLLSEASFGYFVNYDAPSMQKYLVRKK